MPTYSKVQGHFQFKVIVIIFIRNEFKDQLMPHATVYQACVSAVDGADAVVNRSALQWETKIPVCCICIPQLVYLLAKAFLDIF